MVADFDTWVKRPLALGGVTIVEHRSRTRLPDIVGDIHVTCHQASLPLGVVYPVGKTRAEDDVYDSRPNLMRSVAELEDDLHQRVMRNLHPIDVPRGNDYYSAVMKVLESKVLPDTYASSPVWQHAHHLYWQIEALKGASEVVAHHPV